MGDKCELWRNEIDSIRHVTSKDFFEMYFALNDADTGMHLDHKNNEELRLG
jgi:hypothetical protein